MMNWEAIGAVGEIAGALAVVISLVYLASQIRTSNRAAIQTANREMMSESSKFYGQIGTDAKTADLWIRGSINDESMTALELVQYRALVNQCVLIWERAYYLEEEGAVDTWFLKMYRTTRQRVAGSPGFKSWLKENGDFLSDSFRETIEAEIEKSSSYRPLGTDIGLEGKSN